MPGMVNLHLGPIAPTLAARALEMLEYQKDAARKERVDKLVKELAQRAVAASIA